MAVSCNPLLLRVTTYSLCLICLQLITMKINKQRTTFFILAVAVIIFILMSIFNNNHTVDTSEYVINKPWEKEIRIANSDYMKHYLYSVTGFYKELPWAVRTSYSIIQISSLALIILLYILFWDVRRKKSIQKNYSDIKGKYFEKLKEICTQDKEISEKEIKEILELNDDSNFTYSEKILLIDLFLELKMDIAISPNSIKNIQNSIKAFNLQEFMEERLVKGKDSEKLKVIQAVRFLHINIADSYITRLINHRNKDLQKAARLYYIISNDEDPFRYMERKDGDNNFPVWDMMETHQIFYDCRKADKSLPSFIPAMKQINNDSAVEFFIKETAYWGTDKEMDYLKEYLDSEKEPVVRSVLESITLRKTKGEESKLKDIYYEQPENIKRLILYTLSAISPETSISFFKEAFYSTSSQLTKRMALQCLWKAGNEGKAQLESMQETTDSKNKILFLHVKDNIINREKLSLHSIN